jgi:uncharacterized membrane protein YfcA
MELLVPLIGLVVGIVYGIFGAGGSAFATPALAMAGVHGLAAVASPLPATLPGALAGARAYLRNGELDRAILRQSLIGGLPATVLGAIAARWMGGPILLVLSGIILGVMGARMALPTARGAATKSRPSSATIVTLATGIGFLTGLLANSGGFLLVPLFVLVVGMSMRRAAGTSLLTAAAFSVPTVVTHWVLGDIDWRIAGLFALGLIPGSFVGGRLAQRLRSRSLQRVFGVVLIVFSGFFLARLR